MSDMMLFLSERDQNSSILYKWVKNMLTPGQLKKINVVSIHTSKDLVRRYRIKCVPTLVCQSGAYSGQAIIDFLDQPINDKDNDSINDQLQQFNAKREQYGDSLNPHISQRELSAAGPSTYSNAQPQRQDVVVQPPDRRSYEPPSRQPVDFNDDSQFADSSGQNNLTGFGGNESFEGSLFK